MSVVFPEYNILIETVILPVQNVIAGYKGPEDSLLAWNAASRTKNEVRQLMTTDLLIAYAFVEWHESRYD